MTNGSFEMHTLVQYECMRPLNSHALYVMISSRYINKFNHLTPLTSAGYKVSPTLSKAPCGAKYRGLRLLLVRNREQMESDFSI